MTTTESTIRIVVDPTNPGQYFACCGLLELADRLWPGGAEGWFEVRTPARAWRENTLKKPAFGTAQFVSVFGVAGFPVGAQVPSVVKAPPLMLYCPASVPASKSATRRRSSVVAVPRPAMTLGPAFTANTPASSWASVSEMPPVFRSISNFT